MEVFAVEKTLLRRRGQKKREREKDRGGHRNVKQLVFFCSPVICLLFSFFSSVMLFVFLSP